MGAGVLALLACIALVLSRRRAARGGKA
jgi:hypothetical protein